MFNPISDKLVTSTLQRWQEAFFYSCFSSAFLHLVFISSTVEVDLLLYSSQWNSSRARPDGPLSLSAGEVGGDHSIVLIFTLRECQSLWKAEFSILRSSLLRRQVVTQPSWRQGSFELPSQLHRWWWSLLNCKGGGDLDNRDWPEKGRGLKAGFLCQVYFVYLLKHIHKEDGGCPWCSCSSATKLGIDLNGWAMAQHIFLSLDWKLCAAIPGGEDVFLEKQVISSYSNSVTQMKPIHQLRPQWRCDHIGRRRSILGEFSLFLFSSKTRSLIVNVF